MPGLLTDHSILPVCCVYRLITIVFAQLTNFVTHYDIFSFSNLVIFNATCTLESTGELLTVILPKPHSRALNQNWGAGIAMSFLKAPKAIVMCSQGLDLRLQPKCHGSASPFSLSLSLGHAAEREVCILLLWWQLPFPR